MDGGGLVVGGGSESHHCYSQTAMKACEDEERLFI